METARTAPPHQMKIYNHITPARLQELIDYIRTDTTGWKAVDISIEDEEVPDINAVATRVYEFFGRRPGAIFVCGTRKVLSLVMLEEHVDFPQMKRELTAHLPEYNCTVNTGNITREGLEVIAIRLHLATAPKAEPKPPAAKTAPAPAPEASGSALLQKRQSRGERVFFVVDDDMFMRSLLSKVLAPHGKVIALDDGKDLVAAYREHLPDVVFLDIHLPCGSGVDLLEEIIRYDNTAGVIILSADRVKDNVLLSQARGARGFVGKPFTKDKIEEALGKCLEQAELLSR